MTKQSTMLVLLAALVAVAGCTGANQVTSPGEPTTDELPPGVSATEVENASALVDAHATTLDESGYTYRLERNRSVDGETESQPQYDEWRRQTTRIRGDESGGVATVATGFSRPDYNETSQYDYWWNDSTAFSRFSEGNATDYATLDRPSGMGTAFVSDVGFLWGLIDGTEFAVDSVDRTLTDTRITLTSTGTGERAQDAVEYDATIVVDSTGRIRSATEDAVYDTDDRRVTVHTSYELTGTGVSSVERPEWVGAAQANRTAV